MKKISLSTINIIIGVILSSAVFILNIKDTIGYIFFLIGFLLIVSGIILNEKLRTIIINFIISFF